jgi:predicted Zn-dependent protease
MKFTPKELKKNVNVSAGSPLRELFVLLGGILTGLFLIYIILGITLDILVERIPAQLEKFSGNLFSKTYSLQQPSSSKEKKVQKILDSLVKDFPEKDLCFTVHIQDNKDANAVSLPGGHILIFSGLLKEIETENELTMILAHEIGHFVRRDHLRKLGRGLVLVFLSAVLFGADSGVVEFVQNALITAELKFSRKQEKMADKFALDLLYKRYGHVAGATDFFVRIQDKQNNSKFLKFLSTHPYARDRISFLKEQIRKKGYVIKEKIPLNFVLNK